MQPVGCLCIRIGAEGDGARAGALSTTQLDTYVHRYSAEEHTPPARSRLPTVRILGNEIMHVSEFVGEAEYRHSAL